MPHLDEWNASRRAAAAGTQRRWPISASTSRSKAEGREHVWHLYVVRSADRDRLRSALAEDGVATGLHYPLPLHLEPVLARLGYARGAFPVAEDWSFRGFSLPMFAGIEQAEVAAVAEAAARATRS